MSIIGKYRNITNNEKLIQETCIPKGSAATTGKIRKVFPVSTSILFPNLPDPK
uniref:Uncharacterized protein n=1 Tax=Lepeophtheirus salmonis TaxID=72036 RepID=A0A0K2T6P6_LEPSM